MSIFETYLASWVGSFHTSCFSLTASPVAPLLFAMKVFGFTLRMETTSWMICLWVVNRIISHIGQLLTLQIDLPK